MRHSLHRLLHRPSLPALMLASTIAVSSAAAQDEKKLWPNGPPGSEGKTAAETIVPSTDGVRRVATIHQPSLTRHLPAANTATGAAVIIMPGGGHRYLSFDNEGTTLAKWLSARGVAGFVLKYRLAREEGSTYTVEEHALRDAQRAIRLVRAKAKDWHIDPARIGVLGFSAGGELASLAATRFDTGQADAADAIDRISSRPDFQALIYTGGRIAEGPVPANTPPAFICVAADDQNPSRNSLAWFQKFREAGVSAELHVFAAGGHGFGMRDRPLPITGWPARFHEWMSQQGLLTRPPAASASR